MGFTVVNPPCTYYFNGISSLSAVFKWISGVHENYRLLFFKNKNSNSIFKHKSSLFAKNGVFFSIAELAYKIYDMKLPLVILWKILLFVFSFNMNPVFSPWRLQGLNICYFKFKFVSKGTKESIKIPMAKHAQQNPTNRIISTLKIL